MKRVCFALLILLVASSFVQAPVGVGRAAQVSSIAAGPVLPTGGFDFSSAAAPFGAGDPPGVDPALIDRIRSNARGEVSISANPSTGMSRTVRVSPGGDLLPSRQRLAAQDKAAGFFAQYGGLFGVADANSELVQTSESTDRYGTTRLSYQQVYQGVPVFGAVLLLHTDTRGRLTAINGVFIPNLDVDTNPAFSPEQAAERAVAAVQAQPSSDADETAFSLPAADLKAAAVTLVVYRDGLIQGVPGPNLLAYEVEVTGAGLREFVYVNAHTGKIVNRYSAVQDALFRRLFEMDPSNQVWQEGDPFPGALNADQQNIVNFSGDSYYHFFNAFGRDSYNGAGAEMQSVNNDPRIACPNANWNGITTNYCNGVTADDIVAHEWGHAYTEYTHNLIYQWQPGALNESYSDIWGEVVDMLNGAGTDAPAPVRTEGVCSVYTPPLPTLTINSPASIAGDYAAAGASFGPALDEAGLTGNVVLGDDGVDAPNDACTALVNGAAIAGNIALVDRGTCTFATKVKNAQNAGAIGVMVANNIVGPPSPMGGADPTITIPSVMVALSTGNLIKGQLPGVNVTMHTGGGGSPEDSYRWLMGEDSSAFNGAIRDMWSPNCYADPGKVTDAQYQCAATDSGGVHTNSGVPNHGFALLVDGGTFNGQTVNPIGLTKAAHIYWRAGSVYQTPTSDFFDHADALEMSCSDLVGIELEGLSTSSTPAGPSGEIINAADCAAVSAMIAAVELRTDPAPLCNFQPLLQPDAPAICPVGKPVAIFKDGFNGFMNWKLTNQGVFEGWPGINWQKSTNLPDDRSGPAAFAADPNAGNCDGGAGDISGMMSMQSRSIKIPTVGFFVPRMAFTHYVATEGGWDGGNLKISINGGPFNLVPASAYVFNPYNTTLNSAAAGNTNPLAGQAAFSGTNGGEVTGSWGQSQIDLAALGVMPGDTIRLLFDFGMDGCTGIDGWYVDDVQVFACMQP